MNQPALALTAFLVASGLTAAGPAAAQTLDKIAAANRITVSYREAAVPFSYLISPTKPVGFSVDLTEAIVDDLRRQLKRPTLQVAWMPVTGANRIPLLVDGTYDLECGSTTHTAAREKDVAFSISFFYAGTRILARKDAGIAGYADLAGKTVAAPAGSTNEKVIRAYAADHGIDMQVVAAKDYAEGLQMVERGQAAALALDDVLLFGLRANSADPQSLSVAGEPLQVEPYGCMVRKDDPAFKKAVDGAIARLMRSGEFGRMYARWFESPIPPKGVVLGMPMSAPLKANIRALGDRPAM